MTSFDEYSKSLECLTALDEPIWERIRLAFEAGRAAERGDERTVAYLPEPKVRTSPPLVTRR